MDPTNASATGTSFLRHEQSQEEPPRQKHYACRTCNKSYTQKRTLVRHYATLSHCEKAGQPTPNYVCDICRQAFTREDIRKRHILERHYGNKRRKLHNNETSNGAFLLRSPDQTLDDSGSSTSPASANLSKICASLHAESSTEGDLQQPRRDGVFRSPDVKLADAEASEVPSVVWSLPSTGQGSSETPSVLGSPKTWNKLPDKLRKMFRGGRKARRRPPCYLCKASFGNTDEEIQEHIRKHSREFFGEYPCEICKIGFAHKADLQMHKRCAQQGHCGFEFDHCSPCSGHHPPSANNGSQMCDDHSKLRYRLQHWEQSQLQAYLRQVSEQRKGGSSNKDPEFWSFHAVLRSMNSPHSIESMTTLFRKMRLQSAPDAYNHEDHLALQTTRSCANGESIEAAASRNMYGNIGTTTKVIGILKKQERDHDTWLLVMNAHSGNIERVRQLIPKVSDVNVAVVNTAGYPDESLPDSYNCKGWSRPLLAAARGGCRENVELLIKAGADVNAYDGKSDYGTALSFAAAHGNHDAVLALISHGADVDAIGHKVCGSALSCAAKSGHHDVAVALLEARADVEAQDEDGWSALSYAARQGHKEVVELLLNHNASVHLTDGRFGSPLRCAAEGGHSDVVQMLLEHGAPIDARDARGWTALSYAAFNGRESVVDLLLANNAAVTSHPQPYGSILGAAAYNGHESIAWTLMDQGPDKDSREEEYVEALGCAVAGLRGNIVKALLEQGALPQSVEQLRSLFTHAMNGQDIKITRLLLGIGRDGCLGTQDVITAFWTAIQQNGSYATAAELLLGILNGVNEPISSFEDINSVREAANSVKEKVDSHLAQSGTQPGLYMIAKTWTLSKHAPLVKHSSEELTAPKWT